MSARPWFFASLAALAVAKAAFAQEGPRDTWGVTEPPPPAPPAAAEPAPAPTPDAGTAPPPPAAVPPAPPPPAPASPTPPAAAPGTNPDLPTDEGFSIAVRIGYSLPFGNTKDVSFSDLVSSAIPIGIDAGYFLNPHLYLGGFFTYGIGNASTSANTPCQLDVDQSCSAQVLIFGANAHWHFQPKRRFDPWVGGSVAYEVLNLRQTDDATGEELRTAASHGPQLGINGGIDYKPWIFAGLGPYAELNAGRFWGTGLNLHEWLTFGFRLRTNL
jgi:hypothetical protein